MVYVIVQVVVTPNSRFNCIRYRTGGRVTKQQVQWYTLSFRWSCHLIAGSIVYVMVQVVVSSDSRFNGIRYRTGGEPAVW
jgi:intracellular septation protein A